MNHELVIGSGYYGPRRCTLTCQLQGFGAGTTPSVRCGRQYIITKVPYVDPPQLNAIRHAKFRTQKVLFRAVPSRYLRNRDISNFRTMVQKFRFRQTTVQIVYVRERYISNFRTMAQSSGNSCGTKLWNRALWNQGGAVWCSSAHDVRISTVTTGSRRGAHE